MFVNVCVCFCPFCLCSMSSAPFFLLSFSILYLYLFLYLYLYLYLYWYFICFVFCFLEPDSSCIRNSISSDSLLYLIFCFRCNCLLWQRQLKIVYIHSSQRLFSISWVTKFYTHQQASVSFLSFWIVPCESNVLDICTLLFQCPPSSLLETWNIEIKL